MSPRRGKRGLPVGLLIGFVIGFTLLLVGIGALFGLIIDERLAVHRQLDEKRAEIEKVAGNAFREELRRQLAQVDDEIEAALADPLLPNDHLLLVDNGIQIMPPYAARTWSQAREVLDAVAAGKLFGNDLLVERLALAGALPNGYDAWLEHRQSFVLRADLDLAATLVALERLEAAQALDPARAEALLRGSVQTAKGSIKSWFPELLAARPRLSVEDFEHLLARGTILARRVLVRVDDVIARARVAPNALDEHLLRETADHSGCERLSAGADAGYLYGEDWLLRCDGDRMIGHKLSAKEAVQGLGESLGLPARVKLKPANASTGGELVWMPSIEQAGIAATSKEWNESRAEADRRFWFKAIPLGGVALLALIICGLALSLQRRRTQYIDLRSQLLAAVTHELKTPLASIRALAETLELRLADHPAAKDYPRRIVASSERLEFLVDNVLSFARLEREAWKPQLAPIAVSDLAAWLAAEPVTRAVRPVDFSAEVPAGLTLVGDGDLVRLMLSNLLDNAAKYALGDRVRVRLIASQSPTGVRLAISDDGPGLGEHDPKRLFEDFRRGRVEGVRGTGLGLSICKMVMALHRGAIEVAATSPAGTTFVATFPASAEAMAEHVGRPVFTPSTSSR